MIRRTILPAVLAIATCALTPVDATQLCRTHRKTLVVRDQCKLREDPITVPVQENLGMVGPTGPAGPPGPSTGDLRLVDANGADAGIVLSLADYYGQHAEIVRFLTLPGGTAPEPLHISMGIDGINPNNECQGALYQSPSCSGQPFVDCGDLPECDSTTGAFTRFFRDVTGDPQRGACYIGDASEFVRGDFFRRRDLRGFTPQDVTARCQALGGTLASGPALCAPTSSIYCGVCCGAVGHKVGVPEHPFDPALLGTPPFHLAR